MRHFHYPKVDGSKRYCNMCKDEKEDYHTYLSFDHWHITQGEKGKKVTMACWENKCHRPLDKILSFS